MELRIKKKNAITLVELVIALTMTSVLSILLFSIVTKKANFILNAESGTYYCWKDWNGQLYEKTSLTGIHTVSSCRIKIPRNAENISVYVIGGGAGGYVFEKNDVNNALKDKVLPKKNFNSSYCVIFKNYGECTKKLTSDIPKTVINVTVPSKIINTPIILKSIYENMFDTNFTLDLYKIGACTVPVYTEAEGEINYILPYFDDKKIYYYNGKNKEDDCYYDGYIKDSNANDIIATPTTPNNFSIETVDTNLSIDSSMFKTSSPGEIARGTATAGTEYVITTKDIGSGGDAGQNGADTQFGNLIAKGGQLHNVGIDINVTTNIISSIQELENTKKEPFSTKSICTYANGKCNGSKNSTLATLSNIEYNGSVDLTPDFDLKKQNDTIQSGFGLFGASGAAQNCTIDFYPIKSLIYNSYMFSLDDKNIASINCKANFNKGMGGAVIITWD